ncbi:MAG: SDR family oxidoreductase [Betaproteobacteria bacterium]|nr:SDR family oxidoreductase [Betaproteobacteria bacterium]NBY04257.1 SDR family oxidoreductase [Betaproteobacteria bacterium]
MDLHLQGKLVLITGGSAGIGLGMAKAFAAEGCSLVLVARSEPALKRAAQEIAAAHQVSVQVHSCDIGDERTAQVLSENYSHIDILVNNAGAIPGGALEDVSQKRWREGWELKVFGFINMTRAFYQVMADRRHGVILNVIGASATGLDAKYIAGSTGNAAIESLTKSLGSAAPEHGVRVVGISPGLVMTERLQKLLKERANTNFGNESRWLELTACAPFGRTATVDEIAASAVFLASPRSSYTSGAILYIDGGFVHRHNWWG